MTFCVKSLSPPCVLKLEHPMPNQKEFSHFKMYAKGDYKLIFEPHRLETQSRRTLVLLHAKNEVGVHPFSISAKSP